MTGGFKRENFINNDIKLKVNLPEFQFRYAPRAVKDLEYPPFADPLPDKGSSADLLLTIWIEHQKYLFENTTQNSKPDDWQHEWTNWNSRFFKTITQLPERLGEEFIPTRNSRPISQIAIMEFGLIRNDVEGQNGGRVAGAGPSRLITWPQSKSFSSQSAGDAHCALRKNVENVAGCRSWSLFMYVVMSGNGSGWCGRLVFSKMFVSFCSGWFWVFGVGRHSNFCNSNLDSNSPTSPFLCSLNKWNWTFLQKFHVHALVPIHFTLYWFIIRRAIPSWQRIIGSCVPIQNDTNVIEKLEMSRKICTTCHGSMIWAKRSVLPMIHFHRHLPFTEWNVHVLSVLISKGAKNPPYKRR